MHTCRAEVAPAYRLSFQMSQTKVPYTLEFPIRCSPTILYEFLSTPVGLQEWFADRVDQRDNLFYFYWNGAPDTAERLDAVTNEFVRYRWDYADTNELFEFRIEQSAVTNMTILRITDFVEKSELKDAERLWSSQVSDLKHRLGC